MHTPPRKSDFPRQGTPAQQLEFLLGYAVLAPSTHNTQPWLWQIEGEEAALYADRSRAMPALDPQNRELILSCGAALHHLCVAIRAFDFAALTHLFPDPNQPDLLARVRLGMPRPATSHDGLLFGCRLRKLRFSWRLKWLFRARASNRLNKKLRLKREKSNVNRSKNSMSHRLQRVRCGRRQ